MADGMSEQATEFVLFVLLAFSVIFAWLVVLPPTMEILSWTIHRGRYPVRSRNWFEIAVVVPPGVGIFSNQEAPGDRFAPFLSPEHRLSVIVLGAICIVALIYSSYRKRLAPPLMEVFVNCLLLSGVLLDIAIIVRYDLLIDEAVGMGVRRGIVFGGPMAGGSDRTAIFEKGGRGAECGIRWGLGVGMKI